MVIISILKCDKINYIFILSQSRNINIHFQTVYYLYMYMVMKELTKERETGGKEAGQKTDRNFVVPI